MGAVKPAAFGTVETGAGGALQRPHLQVNSVNFAKETSWPWWQ
jgi:hypothetical protein